jgi:hypothetical protein
MTWKPCARSWLTAASTDGEPDGAALAIPASPSADEANAPAAREVRRMFFIVVPFLCFVISAGVFAVWVDS